MVDLLKTVAGGGQTWAHRMRMLRQVFKIALMAACIVSATFFTYKLSRQPKERFQALYYSLKGALVGTVSNKIKVSSAFLSATTQRQYGRAEVFIHPKALEEICQKERKTLLDIAKKELIVSTWLFGGSFLSFLAFFFLRGSFSKKKRHISGNRIRRFPLYRPHLFGNKPLYLGKVPLIKGIETSHILISGGTGSGKTNAFHHLLPQIRAKKQKGVIVDLTGEFISKYYNEKTDFILNPFDARGESWHPWAECQTPFDIEALAKSFIPVLGTEYDAYWKEAAATVFASLLEKCEELEDLVDLMMRGPLLKLAATLEGTEGGAHIDPASEKTAASIRSVLTNHLKCLKYLESSKEAFSIKEWVSSEIQDSWLFLSASPTQRVSIIPLLSAWYATALRSLMALPVDLNRRFWLINDELPAMQKIDGLETCLTEGRKYGACALLAIQSPSQLESIYGHHSAQTIFANCSTKLVFAEQDPILAKKLSGCFGEREVLENQEGVSYGAHEMRDGVTQSLVSRTRPVVSASDIQSLKKNEAFLKQPGRGTVGRIRLKYLAHQKVAEGFIGKSKSSEPGSVE